MSRASLVAALALLAAACGHDARPPRTVTSGRDPAPLGRVIDLRVELPFLLPEAAAGPGVVLPVVLEVEGGEAGSRPARVRYGRARLADGSEVPVADRSPGRTQVVLGEGTFRTGRVGPVEIAGTAFEWMVEGTSPDGGWSLAGRSWESRTGGEGTFRGARRHRFLVASTDFYSGGSVDLVEVRWGRELAVREGVAPASSDPVLRVTGGMAFLVNRLSWDNLVRLDPADGFAPAWQAGTGDGSNPHDVIAAREGVLYVSRYEPPFDDLLVARAEGGAHRGTIPLGDLAENPDGTPRADRMARAGGLVFVGLQDIDRSFAAWGEGKLAAIDPRTDEVVGVVPLGGKNPGTLVVADDERGRERIWVQLAGIYPGVVPGELSGGVVVVDPRALAVERQALDDDDAGGNIGALAMAGPRLGYVVVSTADWTNRVLAFDPAAGRVLRETWSTRDYVPEIEVDGGGLLAVPDRSWSRPGLCLWRTPADPGGNEVLLGCAPLPLPPFSVEALD